MHRDLTPAGRTVLFLLALPTASLPVAWTVFKLAALVTGRPWAELVEDGHDNLLLNTLISFIASAAVLYLFQVRWGRSNFAGMGLALAGAGRRLLAGTLLGAGSFSLVFVLLVAGGSARLVGMGGFGPAGAVASFFLYCLVFASAALIEEAIFRGYALQRLEESFSVVPAVIISSILFSAVHFANPGYDPLAFLNVFLVGLLLSLLYLRQRGLWLPVGFHFAWNLTQSFIFGLPVSGIAVKPLLKSTYGPGLLAGGRFGPESGLAATVILMALLAGTIVVGRRGNDEVVEERQE